MNRSRLISLIVTLLTFVVAGCGSAYDGSSIVELIRRDSTVRDSDSIDAYVLRFASIGECLKCNIEAERLVDSVRSTAKNAVLVGVVNARSPYERRVFQKYEPEFDVVLTDPESVRTALGEPLNVDIAVLNADGEVVYTGLRTRNGR